MRELAATHRQHGFTLLEVIVVLTVIATLAGTLVPMLTASQRAAALADANDELEALGDALRAYYFDRGQFPAAVNAAGFLGAYVSPGVGDGRVRDEWGNQGYYRLSLATSPDIATCYSIGSDGQDDGAAAEALKIVVYGAAPGNQRTRDKMAVIGAALSRHLQGAGTLSGTWSVDRANLGLGAEYAADGFGTPFQLDATTLVLRSAGADRQFGTTDDLTS